MPRRYYRRRRRYTRRRRSVPWYNKKYTPLQLAQKAISGVRYLSGLVNSEKFKHDVTSSSTITRAGTMLHLTNIAQGDGDGQRTGNSIFVRNVGIRFSVLYNAQSGASMTQRVKMMLLIDTQQVGDALPTPSDVLDITGSGSAPLSFLNDQTVGRFKVLKSRMYTLYPDKMNIVSQWNVNLRHHVRYNGAAASDIQKGGIYLLMISSEDNTQPPAVERNIRVSYHDN